MYCGDINWNGGVWSALTGGSHEPVSVSALFQKSLIHA